MPTSPRAPQRPRSFSSAARFRTWLEKHHATTQELLVRLFKNHAREKGLTYRAALDEALCFGWIDGVRRAVDEDSFSVRFTPRKPRSAWSAVNTRRAQELRSAGRIRPPGLAAFRAGSKSRYSYESRVVELSLAYRRHFRQEQAAWTFFQARPAWYRRTSSFWVMSAKREDTRERRLQQLIDCSSRQKTIPQLTRSPKPATPRRR